jgi:uncharacterized cupin superfamily protein
MKKLNLRDIPDESWVSPKGIYGGSGKEISIALGRAASSADPRNRHPFDVELCTIPAGKKPCPFHSHSAQWEFYHVVTGHGIVRHSEGEESIEPGDSFIFGPGEPHQLINNADADLVVLIVADDPMGESCHYPDSNKWLVRSPTHKLIRSEALEYYDGEE